jgi:hypothetical protein
MAQLAIKGHATRGKEVIEILEMLGGRNTKPYLNGNAVHQVYYIRTCNNEIVSATYTTYGDLFKVFTLEEFLAKFPYKVGDEVLYKTYGIYSKIRTMRWNVEKERVFYRLESNKLFVATVDELKPR